MRLLFLFLVLFLSDEVWGKENICTVLWQLDLRKEALKNKYSFSEISEYLYNNIQHKKTVFYTDSTFKNSLSKETFMHNLYEKNQSVAGYSLIKVRETWKFMPEGIVSKVTFLSFENPGLPEGDLYRKLYVQQKYISVVLKEILLSGYYQGRADIPFSEWLQKHDFDYTVLNASASLPKPPYTFQYNKAIDDTAYKRIQLLFDFFPETNRVFNHTYKRDKNTLEELSYLRSYNNEAHSATFRALLLEALQKNKLIKSSPDIEDVLRTKTANFIFYFEALSTRAGLHWTAIRVYISSGVYSAVPQFLCANVPERNIKTIENYFKKNSGYSFTEYFTKIKIDFLVSYINHSYAKDTEEGLVLRQYLFNF